jgi:AAA+ ATPase superfamily predicted ATPase
MIIIGRKIEQEILKNLLETDKSEFVAVLGRKRDGKTFLIHEVFSNLFA